MVVREIKDPIGRNLCDEEAAMQFQLEGYIPYLLHQAHLAILAKFTPVLAEHGLSLQEWRVLAALHQNSPMRFRDLVGNTGLEPPTLARVVAKLEENKRLKRKKSGEDKRGTVISITPSGLAITREAIPKAYLIQEAAVKDFSADEAELLRRLLRRIPANMT